MYPLPDDFDLNLLSGCYLETVCFGASSTVLNFSRARSIREKPYRVSFAVEGPLSVCVNGATSYRDFSAPSTAGGLVALVLQDVARLEKLGASDLKVTFSTGDSLMMDGSANDAYEQYTVYLDDGDILVV